MPLDVNDYEKITQMIGRVEAKIDALRRDFVTADVQRLVNSTVDERFKDMDRRIDKAENAPSIWVMRFGVAMALIFSFLQFLVSIKVLP